MTRIAWGVEWMGVMVRALYCGVVIVSDCNGYLVRANED